MLVLDFKVIQQGFVLILCCEAGVCQVFVDFAPVAQASVVEQLQLICDDEWHYVVCEAFLEHDESADTAVAVLERVDVFELAVEVYDVFKRYGFDAFVMCQQFLHFLVHFLRRAGLFAADFVWQSFVFSYVEPGFSAV